MKFSEMGRSPYRIEFTDDCRAKLGQLGDLALIDDALEALYRGLRSKPHSFPPVPPIGDYRVAKTGMIVRDDLVLPPLHLYFWIIEDDHVVRIVGMRTGRGFGDLEQFS